MLGSLRGGSVCYTIRSVSAICTTFGNGFERAYRAVSAGDQGEIRPALCDHDSTRGPCGTWTYQSTKSPLSTTSFIFAYLVRPIPTAADRWARDKACRRSEELWVVLLALSLHLQTSAASRRSRLSYRPPKWLKYIPHARISSMGHNREFELPGRSQSRTAFRPIPLPHHIARLLSFAHSLAAPLSYQGCAGRPRPRRLH
jgi:hypothetical protein